MLDILNYICQHSGIFRQIQTYSESWHSQTYSCILKHIQNSWFIQTYSEPQTYLVSFRHVIQVLLKSNLCYSELYLGKFRYIQNFGLFSHVYSGIFTKLHSWLHLSRNTFPHSGIFQQIQAYSGSLHYRSKQCKPTPALQVRFFF